MIRRSLVLACIVFAPPVSAQTAGEVHLRRLLSVPLGALPPLAMLMPASRNHNYWVGRIQAGTQQNNFAGDLATAALGLDLQWRGGSSFNFTGGYQWADCVQTVTDCSAHAMIGARARFNIVTGGPTVAAIVGDNSATTTVGAEIGLGYAPNGKVIEISGIAVHRLEGGRMIEHWAHADIAGFMHQIGADADPVSAPARV